MHVLAMRRSDRFAQLPQIVAVLERERRRALGVTVREFEVFRLLAGRLGNKAIATRLHISPRTVEKHVASLITKTAQPDRESLSAFAASLGPADRP